MSKQRKPQGHQVIIDADVMRSASGSENDLSTRCREVLDEVLRKEHSLVRTPSMKVEWDKHASHYSLNWLRFMQARRRLLDIDEAETGLAGALGNLPVPLAEQQIMLKDCHLLEAALAGEKRIISKDEAAYFHFCHASVTLSQLRKIMWASPMRPKDECAEWLADGAKPEANRRIGRRPHRSHPDF
ncbi:MAG: hypothetical protein ACRYFX_31725 [Janthinobacterium lividum]